MNPPVKTTATLTLESRFLLCSLRVEVASAHPSFACESPQHDLQKAAEELLPVALAKVAPEALRQILEEAEALLLDRSIAESASITLQIKTPS